MEKCEENFVEFYRVFCEGVIDNDYESFKNEIHHKLGFSKVELALAVVESKTTSCHYVIALLIKTANEKNKPFEAFEIIKDIEKLISRGVRGKALDNEGFKYMMSKYFIGKFQVKGKVRKLKTETWQ